MGVGSLWHWAIVLIVVLVLFGRGRISEIMGDFGSGIKSFKRGLSEEDLPEVVPPQRIAGPENAAVAPISDKVQAGKL